MKKLLIVLLLITGCKSITKEYEIIYTNGDVERFACEGCRATVSDGGCLKIEYYARVNNNIMRCGIKRVNLINEFEQL